MKNFKLITGLVFACTMAFNLASCEKEKTPKAGKEKTEYALSFRPAFIQDRFGEEEDEDIIQGRYEESNLNGIENANIDLLDSSDSTVTDSDVTDINGEFEVSAPSGFYLFRITEGTNQPTYTDVFQLEEDVQITIQK